MAMLLRTTLQMLLIHHRHTELNVPGQSAWALNVQ